MRDFFFFCKNKKKQAVNLMYNALKYRIVDWDPKKICSGTICERTLPIENDAYRTFCVFLALYQIDMEELTKNKNLYQPFPEIREFSPPFCSSDERRRPSC